MKALLEVLKLFLFQELRNTSVQILTIWNYIFKTINIIIKPVIKVQHKTIVIRFITEINSKDSRNIFSNIQIRSPTMLIQQIYKMMKISHINFLIHMTISPIQ
eukprot:NODE_65_length_25825_cov_1.353844.p21 type:complete len:103 gc:universal NODE_65_length_25825_cov_1.353844:6911-6603(-)